MMVIELDPQFMGVMKVVGEEFLRVRVGSFWKWIVHAKMGRRMVMDGGLAGCGKFTILLGAVTLPRRNVVERFH